MSLAQPIRETYWATQVQAGGLPEGEPPAHRPAALQTVQAVELLLHAVTLQLRPEQVCCVHASLSLWQATPL